jgi:hypothetical protein
VYSFSKPFTALCLESIKSVSLVTFFLGYTCTKVSVCKDGAAAFDILNGFRPHSFRQLRDFRCFNCSNNLVRASVEYLISYPFQYHFLTIIRRPNTTRICGFSIDDKYARQCSFNIINFFFAFKPSEQCSGYQFHQVNLVSSTSQYVVSATSMTRIAASQLSLNHEKFEFQSDCHGH